MPSNVQHEAAHKLLGLNEAGTYTKQQYEKARDAKIEESLGRNGGKPDNALFIKEREELHRACQQCSALPILNQGTKKAQNAAHEQQGKGVQPKMMTAQEEWDQYLQEFGQKSRDSLIQDSNPFRVLLKILIGLFCKDGGYRTSIPKRWEGADPTTTDFLKFDNDTDRKIMQDFVDDFNAVNGAGAVTVEQDGGRTILHYDTPDRMAQFREFIDANYTIDPKRHDEFEKIINDYNQAKGEEQVTFEKSGGKYDLKFAGGDAAAQQAVRHDFKDWVHQHAPGLGPDAAVAAPAPAA